MIPVKGTNGALRFRRDPYALELLPTHTVYDLGAHIAFNCNKRHTSSAAVGVARPASAQSVAQPTVAPLNAPGAVATAAAPPPCAAAKKAVIHFATVRFKFSSATFVAPFRVAPGNLVVCEADGRSESLSEVLHVTTKLPSTRIKYALLRHARPRDLAALERNKVAEAASLDAAQDALRASPLANVVFPADCEWQVDGTCISVLCRVAPCCCGADGRVTAAVAAQVTRLLVARLVRRIVLVPIVVPAPLEDDALAAPVAGLLPRCSSWDASSSASARESAVTLELSTDTLGSGGP